ncbi:MAG: xylose isomerase, partial [Anaerobacillus sp.]
ANQGDTLLGWDTDEFPTDLYATTLAMYEILKNDGLGKGGLNFDAKVRRNSFDPDDLFHAHIAGMDSFAIGLKAAHQMLEDRVLENFISDRYHSFSEGIGKEIIQGKTDFHKLEQYALGLKDIKIKSGRMEKLKAEINSYLLNAFSNVRV